MPSPIFRFAPSPNGLLHLGHAYSALLNHDLAKATGGRFLLRIEDIDMMRCGSEWIETMLDDLSWLGLSWEPPRRQSKHFSDYKVALDQLANQGLLYPSSASRAQIDLTVRAIEHETGQPWPHDLDGAPLYPRQRLAKVDHYEQARQNSYALRLDMARAISLVPALTWQEFSKDQMGKIERVIAEPQRWGDVVLARKEFPTSYHIAVVVDDAIQGVTHVVRGQDLFHATSVHRLLQKLLGLPEPFYHHHPLIHGKSGEKLSKSLASKSLRAFRSEGARPEDIRHLVGLGYHI